VIRLDVLLAEKGLVSSRNRAQRIIREGAVEVDGRPATKPSAPVRPGADVRVLATPPYVSRAGEKLAFAIDRFCLDVRGLNVLDGGASTGGFTDCLLQHGARSVCAVDVGREQLVGKLRENPRVQSLEGTNLRWLRPADVPRSPFDMATVDVSFISLSLVLFAVGDMLKYSAPVVALVKPQFEVGPKRVERGGLVRDFRAHCDALNGVLSAARAAGFCVCDIMPSPLVGSAGNREFLALLWTPPQPHDRPVVSPEQQEGYVVECVEHAHRD